MSTREPDRGKFGGPFEVAIVGAGAAGLTAAIFAAETAAEPLRIAVLERAAKVGAKILISGGGRCNVTHERIALADFHGQRTIVRNVLAAFDERAVVRWFDSLGVALKREPSGKLFPTSDRASTVLEALLKRSRTLGIEILTGCRVDHARRQEDGFVLDCEAGSVEATQVVLATGGRSLPRTGSDGLGWSIARELGHSVSPTHPALVPLVLADDFFHRELSGLSLDVTLSTYDGGKRIDQRTGSLLFTHFGISGPVVLDASRHWVIAASQDSAPRLHCNFLPAESFASLERRLVDAGRTQPRQLVRTWLGHHLPTRLADRLAQPVADIECGQLSRPQRRKLVHDLTELELPVRRERGWDFAEVTAGGVPLAEIDFRTMESRRVPGLYLVGEMLDCDGRIGGFNFQWAWATGQVAGKAIARARD